MEFPIIYVRDQFSQIRTGKPKILRFLGYVFPHTKGALDGENVDPKIFSVARSSQSQCGLIFEIISQKGLGGALTGTLLKHIPFKN